MADQNLNIGIKVTADTSGANQATTSIGGVTDAIQEQTAATNQLAAATARATEQAQQFISANAYGKFDDTLLKTHDAMRKTTVSANGVAQATKEVGKSGNNGAMGLLALSNAVQDVQYGFGGMVNNIPQIITGLGMGMGVAGAVQIAAVGFQFLLKNVDLFGQKAEEAREKAGELASEMADVADKASKEAASVESLAAARESQAAAMAKVDEAYKTTIALSDKAIKQAQEEKDAQTALIDAQAGMQMARIALAESRGEMTKEEAIYAKEKARTEAESRKQTAQTAAEEAKAAELKKKAAAEEAAAEAKRKAAAGLAEGGAGLMNEKEREQARKNVESMKAFQDVSRERQAQLAREIDEKSLIDFDPEMTERNRAANRKKLADERDEYAKTQAAIDRENAKLAADEAAKRKTGLTSRDELNKAVDAENKAAEQGIGRAGEFREQASGTEAGISRSRQLFNMRQATAAMTAQAQAEAEQRARNAAANSGYGIDFTGPVPPQGFAADQKEAAKAAKEADSANRSNTASTIKIIRALANELKLTKEQLSALNGVVEDIRTTK